MDVKLVIFKSDGNMKEIPVRPGRYIIGRRPDASLRIPLPSVSRDHCEIVHDGKSLSVRDLGSSNGTFKNSERVKQATLGPGDVLCVGPLLMTVQIDGKPANIKPPAPSEQDDDDALMDTPAEGSMTRPPRRAPATEPEGSMEETITKPSPMPAASGGKRNDDSSIFDFDFDFEDEDRPKL